VTLSDFSTQLEAAENEKNETQGSQFVQSGLALLKSANVPTLEQELVFTIKVFNFATVFPKYRRELKDVIDLLKVRHQNDPVALARILKVEAMDANRGKGSRKHEGEVLEQAISKVRDGRINAALLELAWINQLGDSYIDQASEKGGGDGEKLRNKALDCYRLVLDFPLTYQPYRSHAAEFHELYIEAAVRAVGLMSISELRTAHFYPFALNDIQKRQPRRFKYIDPTPPGVTEFTERVAFWLRLEVKDQPEDSTLRPHLQAVLKYVTSGKNGDKEKSK
jgi:hypothetical protein